jgi:hypothetical protein
MTALSVRSQEHKTGIYSYFRKGRGVGLVTADSSYSLNFQFRIQNRAAYISKTDEDLDPEAFEFRVRRLRMKFEGFVANPKLTYYIQLSFSRGDMDWRGPDNSTVNSSPNVVRDAVIYYAPTNKLRLGFGQTKLPGNRQRVISSGDQQFADRSIVNATFNIDRDFGFFAAYSMPHVIIRGALTSGEGRNSLISTEGLAYTGRVELLPFGHFTGNNDYIEGDLERESSPRLSMAVTYHYNENALRQAGQLGNDLYAPRNLTSFEADGLFKYRGYALYAEYMTRDTDSPITADASNATRTVYVGRGFLLQGSYLFRNNLELAARYARTKPGESVYNDPVYTQVNVNQVDQWEAGITKYVNGHRLKFQGNIIYSVPTDLRLNVKEDGFWSAVFQIELGI